MMQIYTVSWAYTRQIINVTRHIINEYQIKSSIYTQHVLYTMMANCNVQVYTLHHLHLSIASSIYTHHIINMNKSHHQSIHILSSKLTWECVHVISSTPRWEREMSTCTHHIIYITLPNAHHMTMALTYTHHMTSKYAHHINGINRYTSGLTYAHHDGAQYVCNANLYSPEISFPTSLSQPDFGKRTEKGILVTRHFFFSIYVYVYIYIYIYI